MTTQAERAAAFRALHERPRIFAIPNPWDAGSARMLRGGYTISSSPLDSAISRSASFSHVTCTSPRFSIANREKVAGFAAAIQPVGDQHRASIAQIVIAWTLAQPGVTFGLCGARNPAQAIDNARAGEIRLSPEDHAIIDRAITAWLSAMDG